MGYEIDFLPVGKASKGGDAICLRYGNLFGPRAEQTVIVIDSGYTDDGSAMVDHIKLHYGTDHVDFVVSTHPDQDHITGLEVVLENMSVGALLMHLPWKHSVAMASSRQYGFSKSALSEKTAKSLQDSADLESIASRLNIPIIEPFAGMTTQDGHFRILGPTLEYYETLISAVSAQALETKRGFSLSEVLSKAAESVWDLVPETLWIETLRDDGDVSPANKSSVICMLDVDDRKSLFTADAGIESLENAISLLEADGFQPGDLRFCQIPHHGSRRNVGPSVLNRLLGEKGQADTHSTAFVSAPLENPKRKHPAKKVTNAFTRRGYAVHGTQGVSKWHHHNAPPRSGYSASTPLPFHSIVEEDSEA